MPKPEVKDYPVRPFSVASSALSIPQFERTIIEKSEENEDDELEKAWRATLDRRETQSDYGLKSSVYDIDQQIPDVMPASEVMIKRMTRIEEDIAALHDEMAA